jgi:sulfur-oxidizing protein SoxY
MTLRRRTLLGTPALVVVRPAIATPESMEAAIQAFTGGAPVQTGRIQFDIAPLVENGNTVPVRLSVEGAAGAPAPVRAYALFTSRNPQPDVAIFRLGPRAGATVSTRMRLATSQNVVAIAQLADGSFWQARVAVEVTLAACVEGS